MIILNIATLCTQTRVSSITEREKPNAPAFVNKEPGKFSANHNISCYFPC